MHQVFFLLAMLASARGLRISHTSGSRAVHATASGRVGRALMQEVPAGNASAAVGLAGLAASGVGVSTLVATTAGVCAGGACAVGAGVGAPAAAAAAGGFGAWVAGGLVAAATFFGVPNLPAPAPLMTSSTVQFSAGGVDYNINPQLATMIQQATPPSDIKGTPVVIEFFRPACPRCNRLAPALLPVEEGARREGVSWTMINTDDPSAAGLIRSLGVSSLPHFSFITAEGKQLARMAGAVDSANVADGVDMLLGRWVPPD